MNIQATFDLLNLRGIFPATNLSHEHTAVRHKDVESAAEHFRLMGYSICVRGDRQVAFVQKASHRVEIIHPNVAPPHEAFAVRDVVAWQVAREAVRAALGTFEITLDQERDDFRNLLFRHKATGAFLQIVWRAEQIYGGVFPDSGGTSDGGGSDDM